MFWYNMESVIFITLEKLSVIKNLLWICGEIENMNLGKTSTEKKRFLSGIALVTYPPPPDPNSGNLVLFSEVKIQDLKSV